MECKFCKGCGVMHLSCDIDELLLCSKCTKDIEKVRKMAVAFKDAYLKLAIYDRGELNEKN